MGEKLQWVDADGEVVAFVPFGGASDGIAITVDEYEARLSCGSLSAMLEADDTDEAKRLGEAVAPAFAVFVEDVNRAVVAMEREEESPAKPAKPFEGADFYDCDESAESLSHTTVADAVTYVLDVLASHPTPATAEARLADLMDAIESVAPLEVVAFKRTKVDLDDYADSLVDRLVEMLDEDEMLADPEGNHSVTEGLDHKALAEAIGKAIVPFSSQVKPWHCTVVARRVYSAAEIEALMRSANPGWFEGESKAVAE